MPDTVEFKVTDRIARITLNRPDAANGIDATLTRELTEAAAACDRDETVKAVVLTGRGRFFSAGGDLKAMLAARPESRRYVKSLAGELHRAISTLARMEPPLIVAVNGTAAGGGFSLAILGDIVVASEEASFTMAYTRAALSPDGASTYYLPRLVGLRRAQELIYTNRKLSAAEAVEWGLIHEVVPADALAARADELAAGFVSGARTANAFVKKLLLSSFDAGLEEQMEHEARSIAACAGSPDGHEGLDAFVEKRQPEFA